MLFRSAYICEAGTIKCFQLNSMIDLISKSLSIYLLGEWWPETDLKKLNMQP